MTANSRVFRWVARWVMRAEAAGNLLRLVFFGLTGLSTALITLKQYGHDAFAWPFTVTLVLGTVGFMYAYAEWGLLNQKNRDRVDVGDNYSGPTMLMDAKIEARQLAWLGYVLKNGDDVTIEELEQELDDRTVEEWARLRDGIDVEQMEELHDAR